eukprot:4298869-Prymnesium_polylepis.1
MGTATRMLAGAAVLLILNYAFNELMDESGLFVTVVTATLPADQRDPVKLALFRQAAGVRADEALKADRGLLRSELLRLKEGVHAYAFVAVHRLETGSDAAAAASAAGVESASAPQ